jgi:hypothetical protein
VAKALARLGQRELFVGPDDLACVGTRHDDAAIIGRAFADGQALERVCRRTA